MRIIIDEVDNSNYMDIILTPNDMKKIRVGEMTLGEFTFKYRKFYVGIRLQGEWDDDDEEETNQSSQGDEGVFERRAPQRLKRRPRSSESEAGASHRHV
jgi:hypothetical protein